VNGLQVCFASQIGNEGWFHADYTDAPTTDISYDEVNKEFSIKFQDTIFAKQYAGTDSLQDSNIYIESLKLKSEGNSSFIILKLSEVSKYYIGNKGNLFEYPFNIDTPYIDLQFSGNTD